MSPSPQSVEIQHAGAWIRVCDQSNLLPGRGVAALAGDDQVAVFRDRAGELYAVQNYDPFSRAYVISRGLIGSRGDVPLVHSPMYKHAFDLRTGECLDEPTTPDGAPAQLRTWPVRLRASEA